MPNEKKDFITGAVVGATVNFIIQSAQMAMDYDRPFDWGEFFLCTGAGAFAANPKGIASFSPEVLCAEKCFFIKLIHLVAMDFTERTHDPCFS
jgi:hypothetical protein